MLSSKKLAKKWPSNPYRKCPKRKLVCQTITPKVKDHKIGTVLTINSTPWSRVILVHKHRRSNGRLTPNKRKLSQVWFYNTSRQNILIQVSLQIPKKMPPKSMNQNWLMMCKDHRKWMLINHQYLLNNSRVTIKITSFQITNFKSNHKILQNNLTSLKSQ